MQLKVFLSFMCACLFVFIVNSTVDINAAEMLLFAASAYLWSLWRYVMSCQSCSVLAIDTNSVIIYLIVSLDLCS